MVSEGNDGWSVRVTFVVGKSRSSSIILGNPSSVALVGGMPKGIVQFPSALIASGLPAHVQASVSAWKAGHGLRVWSGT